MLEILNVHAWALEPNYANRAKSAILKKIEAGADLTGLGLFNPEMKKNRQDMYAGISYDREIGAYIHATDAGKVAHIPMVGTMTKRGGMCTYGAKDYVNSIAAANASSQIEAIVLEVDGPGGEVDGTEELAMAVASSKKPVVGYVDGMAASAHYWVVSQASYIFANSANTSWIGSIGTLIVHVDETSWLEKNGVKVEIIRSERSIDKARGNSYESLTDQARADLVKRLDGITEHFINTVKSGRGENLIANSEDIFTGKMYKGSDAVTHGLVNEIGNLSQAISKALELSKTAIKSSSNKSNLNSSEMSLKKWFAGTAPESTTDAAETVSINAAELTELKADMQAAQSALEAAQADNVSLAAQVANLAASELQLKAQVADLEKKPAGEAAVALKEADANGGEATTAKPADSQASHYAKIAQKNKK